MKGDLDINMKIKLYGAEWCVFCVKAKDFLEKNNIDFEYINVQDNHEAGKYVLEKTKQTGIPVIEIIDDKKKEFIIGFDEEALRKRLKIK